jgi:trehalose 6-phosphate synthase/phosphatase
MTGFNYKAADPEYGGMQAKELKDHLGRVLANFDVALVEGNGYVEVHPSNVNKGAALKAVLRAYQNVPADMLLVVGDDASDESVCEAAAVYADSVASVADGSSTWQRINALYESRLQLKAGFQAHLQRGTVTADVDKQGEPTPDSTAEAVDRSQGQVKTYTCTVGKKLSEAQFFVDDVDDVVALLETLRLITIRNNRVASVANFQSLASRERENSSSATGAGGDLTRRSASSYRRGSLGGGGSASTPRAVNFGPTSAMFPSDRGSSALVVGDGGGGDARKSHPHPHHHKRRPRRKTVLGWLMSVTRKLLRWRFGIVLFAVYYYWSVKNQARRRLAP